MCTRKFGIISELEMHMKKEHKDYMTYECDTCRKKFITKWRLEKHLKMHKYKRVKKCKYLRNKTPCPFYEFGCKFGHDEIIVKNATNDNLEVIGQTEDSLGLKVDNEEIYKRESEV